MDNDNARHIVYIEDHAEMHGPFIMQKTYHLDDITSSYTSLQKCETIFIYATKGTVVMPVV